MGRLNQGTRIARSTSSLLAGAHPHTTTTRHPADRSARSFLASAVAITDCVLTFNTMDRDPFDAPRIG
jgi:hypothetical protein